VGATHPGDAQTKGPPCVLGAARGALVTFEDARAGKVAMPAVFPFLSATPGRVDHLGPPLGAHLPRAIQLK